jgi:predicted aldo/keto reductase-like oxidoreductase
MLAYDMVEYAKMRYNLLGNVGDWFPGENATKAEGHDLSGCLQGYRYADRVPGMLAEVHEILGGKEVKRLQQECETDESAGVNLQVDE